MNSATIIDTPLTVFLSLDKAVIEARIAELEKLDKNENVESEIRILSEMAKDLQ